MLERAQQAQATAGSVAGGRPSFHSNCGRVARSVRKFPPNDFQEQPNLTPAEFTLGYQRCQDKRSRRGTSATAYAGYAPSSIEYITSLGRTDGRTGRQVRQPAPQSAYCSGSVSICASLITSYGQKSCTSSNRDIDETVQEKMKRISPNCSFSVQPENKRSTINYKVVQVWWGCQQPN